MVKSFVHLADGDEVMVVFDTEREQYVFKEVSECLKNLTHKMDLEDPNNFYYRVSKDVKFDTTLQAQVAADNFDILRKMAGLSVLNVCVDSKSAHLMKQYRKEGNES